MEKLVVVCSVTIEKCFEIRLKKSLLTIGVPYTLILTDPNLTLSKSYNSVINYPKIEHSTYILFVAQDIEFIENNWGQKLLDYCGVCMQDLGCAGVECHENDYCYANHFRSERTWRNHPMEVATCDGEIIIVPTEIFLKRQFDEQFDWFPMAEDYQLQMILMNHKKVYSFPLRITGNCPDMGLAKWNSQFGGFGIEYRDAIRDGYMRLYKKWLKLFPSGKVDIYGRMIPLNDIPNTSWNRSQELTWENEPQNIGKEKIL